MDDAGLSFLLLVVFFKDRHLSKMDTVLVPEVSVLQFLSWMDNHGLTYFCEKNPL